MVRPCFVFGFVFYEFVLSSEKERESGRKSRNSQEREGDPGADIFLCSVWEDQLYAYIPTLKLAI